MKFIIALALFAVAANACDRIPRNVEMPTRGVNYKSHAGRHAAVASAIEGDSKIINGELAVSGQFPWQVSVTMDGSSFCGGSVISDMWVMTAGHCVDGVISFELVFGSLSPDAGAPGTMSQTSRGGILHEEYRPAVIQNDIGLVGLTTALTLTPGGQINSVRLPARSQAGVIDAPGGFATISGWGKTKDGLGGVSSDLYYVSLEILDNTACAAVYGDLVIFDTTICMSGVFYSTCSGDSGGPLVVEEADGMSTEIGIVSFGASAGCELDYPLGFTRVTSYLDWINGKTGIAIMP